MINTWILSTNMFLQRSFHDSRKSKLLLIRIIISCVRGVGRGGGGGGGGGGMAPIKSGQGAKKGHIFLPHLAYPLLTNNQYFLVTLFPHIVNLPANFSMRSQTVITTNCSEKINFGNFQ